MEEMEKEKLESRSKRAAERNKAVEDRARRAKLRNVPVRRNKTLQSETSKKCGTISHPKEISVKRVKRLNRNKPSASKALKTTNTESTADTHVSSYKRKIEISTPVVRITRLSSNCQKNFNPKTQKESPTKRNGKSESNLRSRSLDNTNSEDSSSEEPTTTFYHKSFVKYTPIPELKVGLKSHKLCIINNSFSGRKSKPVIKYEKMTTRSHKSRELEEAFVGVHYGKRRPRIQNSKPSPIIRFDFIKMPKHHATS